MTDYTNLKARLREYLGSGVCLEAAAAIAELEAERDALREQIRESALQELASLGQAQEAYEAQKAAEAQIAALTARVEGLTGALDKARTQDRDPDYVYDEEWEYTMRWDEWPDLVDGHDLTEPMPIYTLYKGPTKWVVQIPIDTDGDGETDDFETKLFDSEETARAALSTTDYTLAPHLQKIVDGAKTAPQWDMQADRLAPTDAATQKGGDAHDRRLRSHEASPGVTAGADAAQAREAAIRECADALRKVIDYAAFAGADPDEVEDEAINSYADYLLTLIGKTHE